jgi:stage V sporulation protein G
VEVTDVRVKLLDEAEDKLRGFCTITLAGQFVVRDVKIIEGGTGYFIAMPSRKLTDRCGKCRHKNHLRAKFCNECGGRLDPGRVDNQGGRGRLHADVAHPISQECREAIQDAVIDAFHAELEAIGETPKGAPAPAPDPAPAPAPDPSEA